MENITRLRVVAFQMPPFVSVVRYNDGKVGFTGPLAELLFRVLNSLNISLTLLESPYPSHGVVLPSGNVTGIIRILYENKADITPIPYGFTLERLRYMDFATPFYYAIYRTMSGSPKGFTKNEVSFFDIFNLRVWLLLGLSTLIVAISVSFVSKFSDSVISQRHSWFTYLFFFYASITRQEIPVGLYVGNRKRELVVAFWLLGSFCLTSAFMGMLLSSLTIHEKPERIDAAEDVVKYPNVKPLVMKDSLETIHLKYSVNPKSRALWNQIVAHGGEIYYKDIFTRENLEKTSKGLYVILSDVSLLRRSLSYGCVTGSHFYLSKTPHFYSPITFGLRRGLPYSLKKALTRILTMYAATEQLPHYVLQSTIAAEKCLRTDDDDPENDENWRPLSIENFKFVFLCWAFGETIAILVFVFELIAHRNGTRNSFDHSKLRRTPNK